MSASEHGILICLTFESWRHCLDAWDSKTRQDFCSKRARRGRCGKFSRYFYCTTPFKERSCPPKKIQLNSHEAVLQRCRQMGYKIENEHSNVSGRHGHVMSVVRPACLSDPLGRSTDFTSKPSRRLSQLKVEKDSVFESFKLSDTNCKGSHSQILLGVGMDCRVHLRDVSACFSSCNI